MSDLPDTLNGGQPFTRAGFDEYQSVVAASEIDNEIATIRDYVQHAMTNGNVCKVATLEDRVSMLTRLRAFLIEGNAMQIAAFPTSATQRGALFISRSKSRQGVSNG